MDVSPPDRYRQYLGAGWDTARFAKKWVHVQGFFEESSTTVDDGSMALWLDGERVVNRLHTVRTRTGATSWNRVLVGYYMGRDALENCVAYPYAAHAYLDDVYVDTSQARIELGDQPTYEASRHRETQVPATWSDGAITFKVNRGSFPSLEGKYLYVVSSDGQVNASGYRLGAATKATPSTPGIVRGNLWMLRNTNTTGMPDLTFSYGQSADKQVIGDWDGDGKYTAGVVRGNVWYLTDDNATINRTFAYGEPADVPVVGDWDRDGKYTAGVVRGNVWYLTNDNATVNSAFTYGDATDVPIVGDWDGDGSFTPGVVRGNLWMLRNANTTGLPDITFTYGLSTDTPVVGDWDGDGRYTAGGVRGNVWLLRNSNTAGSYDINFSYGDSADRKIAWKSR